MPDGIWLEARLLHNGRKNVEYHLHCNQYKSSLFDFRKLYNWISYFPTQKYWKKTLGPTIVKKEIIHLEKRKETTTSRTRTALSVREGKVSNWNYMKAILLYNFSKTRKKLWAFSPVLNVWEKSAARCKVFSIYSGSTLWTNRPVRRAGIRRKVPCPVKPIYSTITS